MSGAIEREGQAAAGAADEGDAGRSVSVRDPGQGLAHGRGEAMDGIFAAVGAN